MTTKQHNRVQRRLQAKLDEIGQKYTQLFANGLYEQALLHLRRARKKHPIPAIIYEEALCLAKLGRLEEAYRLAKSNPPTKPTMQYHDILADICGQLDNLDEARIHGDRSLSLRAAQVSDRMGFPLPAISPPDFLPGSGAVISFSLFGDNPRYCETAILNCRRASELLPNWVCRFYCDETVPTRVVQRLSEAGGEIVILPPEDRNAIPKLLWRFLVNDDESVRRYLVRDADSLITVREAAAVRAWLNSDSWFHLLRDYYTHYELMLAGLWGGCTGVIPSIRDEIIDFLAHGTYKSAFVDQHFLRYRIWPTVRQSVLIHDSQFSFFNSLPFPLVEGGSTDPRDHVGANISSRAIGGNAPDAKKVTWTVRDEDGNTICQYQSCVIDGKWEAVLPAPYIDRIADNSWSVTTACD